MKRPRGPLNWIQWLTILNVIVLAVTVPVIVGRLASQAADQKQAIRTVICFFDQRITATNQLNAAQKRQAHRLYAEALATINAKPCMEGAP